MGKSYKQLIMLNEKIFYKVCENQFRTKRYTCFKCSMKLNKEFPYDHCVRW